MDDKLEEFKEYVSQMTDWQLINAAKSFRDSWHSMSNISIWFHPPIPIMEPIIDAIEPYMKILEYERYRRLLPQK